MGDPKRDIIRQGPILGWCRSDPPTTLPEWMCSDCLDIEFHSEYLLRKRPVSTAVSMTSGPTTTVIYLYEFVTTAGVSELWAFSVVAGALVAHRRVAGTWSSVSLIDTAVTCLPHCATLNGKLFIAYDSSANRLHLWDGSAVRRVGIVASAAPTAANGGGAGVAVIRYYKVRFLIISGSDTVASSELSASVSFTPGANGVTVTKPTTPDSATHWIVYGSADDVTFFALSGNIVVATTTYLDNATPAAYTGSLAPTPGQFIPPPSAKMLLTDGNRLLMAGAYESTAGTGETVPKTSRIWFTPLLGSSDIGDDERIPNSAGLGLKNWTNIGEGDGDECTALSGPVDGVIYGFKNRSIWSVTPTGNASVPYRVDRVNATTGCVNWYCATSGEISAGVPCVYYDSTYNGPYRISPSQGVEMLGYDWINRGASNQIYPVYWASRRTVWWKGSVSLQIDFMRSDDIGRLRGGWARHAITIGSGLTAGANIETTVVAANVLYLGGGSSSGVVATIGSGTTDVGSTVVSPYVVTKAFLLGSSGLNNASVENPVLETFTGQTETVAYISDYSTSTARSQTIVDNAGQILPTYVKFESVMAADTRVLQVQVTQTGGSGGVDTSSPGGVTALLIPYRQQEPV